MNKVMCTGKIHRATVTDANLNYEGSITIDKTLMEAANMLAFEKVHIVNINNGARFETYIIEGERNSGVICLNGAASRLVQKEDKVIIIAYASMSIEKAKLLKPALIMVNSDNKICEQKSSFKEKELIYES